MYKNPKNQFKSNRSRYIIGLVFLVVAIATIGILEYRHYPKKPITTIKTADGKTVTLSPPTQEEKKQTDVYKNAIVNDSKATPSASSKKTSTVFISSASASGVNAYVTGVFEDDGTCTVTATQGSQVFTKSSAGFQNVSYTQCAPISWDAALGSGSWGIVVTYSSSTTNSSQSINIQI